VALSDDDVREILRLIDESDLDELRVETPELTLHVRRRGHAPQEGAAPPAAAPTPATAAADGAAEGAPPPTAGPVPAPIVPRGLHSIDSPMLGVFYRAPAPGATPFVQAGGRVEPDTVVCLIEVMKMMNSIVAGVSGTIVEVCAENADLVEHGQPLFRVELA
jgi:acetyl-CoA carboxylase biotin carboxyl carrier protein